MDFIFERKINYYETDKMGVVHHSNYIRYMEEARCDWLESIGMPFSVLEENGVTIPVIGVYCEYKNHVTFDDIITIKPSVMEYTGVRMTIQYDVKNKKTGKTVIIAETKHCFTNKDLRPVNLKKYAKEFSDKFQDLILKKN